MVESEDESPSTRKSINIKEATSLFKDHIGVETTVTNAVRIGRKGTKPRLLNLSLHNLNDKVTILCNKFKLRKTENSDYIKSIFITPDYTPMEQQKNKKLRNQLKEMNKESKDYMIKTES